jgi:hypothetical protein
MVATLSCDSTPTVTSPPRPSARPGPTVAASIDFAKSCSSPVSVGDPYACRFSIANPLSNTLRISGLSDVVHAVAGDVPTGNVLGSMPLVFTGAVTCSGGIGAGTVASPYLGATDCVLPPGASIQTQAFSSYVVQAADYALPSHQLADVASLTWNDTCTPNATGCSATDQTATASASAVVQLLPASVSTSIHDGAHGTVAAIGPNITVHDFGTVSGAAGKPIPTGTVTLEWFTNGGCTTAAASSTVGPLDGAGRFDAVGFAFTPGSVGQYAFRAHYLGDATYAAADGACEPLPVVDAAIQIAPAATTNSVNTTATLTAHVNTNDGSGSASAPDGTQISFTIDAGPGGFTSTNPCVTSGATGSCTIALTSAVVGITSVSAHVSISVGGLPLTRATDGIGGNSAAALITWELPNPVVVVSKACPSGKQSSGDRFAIALNGTATGVVLDCGQQANVILSPNTAFSITEYAGSMTTNPLNYSSTYSGCSGAGLASGSTTSCTVSNTRVTPRSRPQTSGYWKNHVAELNALLPLAVGNVVVASANAGAVFEEMNCGNTKDLSVAACLAGQMMAAKLNVKNGASNCIDATIGVADALLIAFGYAGPGQPLSLTPTRAQRQSAVALKDALDRYNTGRGC